MGSYIKEACVEGFDQSICAEKLGADRIELCADLAVDGLTPDEETIREVKAKLNIPIRVMIRSRSGNFVYSKKEIEEMMKSIEVCKEIGVEGVVFGACTKDRKLDISVIEAMANWAQPLSVTIHKAIDECDDPVKEIGKLLKLRTISSVLTSGKAARASDGIKTLQGMLLAAGDKLEIVACGKVTNENVESLDKQLNAKAYHGKLIVGSLNNHT